jgi:alkanesulfonate monooxygenase SsuD/methylene tetrahydromethanopterin reductase-like flavin-dependent oxidoreductase (luciferase family)
MITHPKHPVPIYLASIGPKNVQLTAEIADGWLPVFYSPERAGDVFGGEIAAGFAAADDPTKAARFDIAPSVAALVSDDVARARDVVRPGLALYIGGMGSRGRNFYNDLACRYGFERAAAEIQDNYLAGKPFAAANAVPDALIDEVCLVGTAAMVRDRLAAWRESGVTTLNISTTDVGTLRTLAEIVL